MSKILGLQTIAISSIRDNAAKLRDVNVQSEEFLGLVDSIKEKGFIGTISVRAQVDPDTKEDYFEVVDGLHRFTACKTLGMKEIKVDVVEMDDSQVLEGQIVMNLHKIATKPAEYAKQMRRMLSLNPFLTVGDIALKIGKSSAWINNLLAINNIANAEISALIDSGKICLANAIALSKLPSEEQDDFIERAITMKAEEFIPTTNARVKELRDAKMKGKDASAAEFAPVAHLQKMANIREELDRPAVVVAIARQEGITDPEALVKLTLSWVLNLDPVSVAAQKAKDDERKAIAKAAADKRNTERLAKAAAKKLEEAEALQLQVKQSTEAQG